MKLAPYIALVVLLAPGCATDPQKAKLKYLESGQRYMKKHDYNSAVLQFRNAVSQDRRFVDGYYNLALAFLGNRQPRDAFAALSAAFEIDPNRVDVRLGLARIQLAAGNLKEAADHANFIIGREPANGQAYQLLGGALAAQKDTEGARRAMEKAIELAPKEPVLRVEYGLLLASAGNLKDAEASLNKATEVAPDHIPGWLALAGFYRSQNRIQEAEQLLQTARDRNPDAVPIYLAAADLLLAQSKTEALDALLTKLRDRQRKPETALALGDFFTSRGQPDRAVAEYRRGIEIAPNNIDLKIRLVEYHLAAGQIDEAEKWNSAILKEKPKDVRAGIARGRILLARNQREEAIAELRKQVSQERESSEAHYFLAEAYLRNDNSAQAKDEFQEAAKLAPGSLAARLGLGNLQLALGDVASARITADTAVQDFPDQPGARLLLGNVLLRQNDIAAARVHFDTARQQAPNDPSVLLSLGQSYASERRWAEAEKEIEAALKVSPRNTAALSELTGLLNATGQSGKATARMEQYTSGNADDPKGHLMLGSLYRKKGDLARAELEYNRALQLDPKLLQAHLQLGGVYREMGRLDPAIQQFEAALKLDPRSSALHVLLGSARYEKGDFDQSRKLFEQAATMDPNSAVALNNFAALSAATGGNLDTALTLAQKARQLAPNLVNAADTLGWIQYKKGLHQAAVPLLEECVKKAPQTATYQYHLGMALSASGQKDKARAHLENALRLKLSGEEAAQAREHLSSMR